MKLEVNDMRPFKLWADGEKEVVNAGAAEGTIMHGDEGFVLRRGYAYEATCYEYVKIPKQVVAFIYGRSTLHRNGIFCRASVYDSGFEDYAGLMIFPFCDFWVEKRTRIAQIVFMQSQGDSMYNGQYGKQGRSKRVEM
jgi:deoxycytidine triphosphate deaminase